MPSIVPNSSPLDSNRTPENQDLYTLIEEYRKRLLDRIKKNRDIKRLFREYLDEIRQILGEKRLPQGMSTEILRLVSESFDLLREISKERDIETLPEEEIAKFFIGDAKTASNLALTTQERVYDDPILEVPTDDLDLERYLPGLILPPGNVGYKGGVARIALKLYAQKILGAAFSQSLLDNELPLADKDTVIGPDEKDVWGLAIQMGVDPDGVEKLEKWDIGAYFATRDLDLNQVLLTQGKLYFSSAALESVRTGEIHAGQRGRNIFGTDFFRYKNKTYLTSTVIHRLIKMVTEGKAHSFELPQYNLEVKLGIYWLVILRKLMKRKDAALCIAKLHDCAKQMGQTSAENPSDFFDELKASFPFFDFQTHQSNQDIARWILTKYTTLLSKYLKTKFEVYSEDWNYVSEDKTSVKIQPEKSYSTDSLIKAERVLSKIRTNTDLSQSENISADAA